MPNAPKKYVAITQLQALAILLVVLGHCAGRGSVPTWYLWMHEVIYSFHMPLFMMTSGFLFVLGQERERYERYGPFILQKAKRLLLPYVTLNLVAFLPKCAMAHFAARPISCSWTTLGHALVDPTKTVIQLYWFLPTLFVIFLVFYFVRFRKLGKIPGLLPGVLLLLIILQSLCRLKLTPLLGIQRASYFVLYFYAGGLVAHYRDKIFPILHSWTALFFTVAFYAIAFFTISNLKAWEVATALSGSLAVIMVGFLLTEHRRPAFRFLWGHSYQIYLLSWFPQALARLILDQVLHLPFMVTFLGLLISGLAIPIVVAKFIERNMPFLKPFIGL